MTCEKCDRPLGQRQRRWCLQHRYQGAQEQLYRRQRDYRRRRRVERVLLLRELEDLVAGAPQGAGIRETVAYLLAVYRYRQAGGRRDP